MIFGRIRAIFAELNEKEIKTMTLVITILAAAVSTLIWYGSEKARQMKVSVLCWLFWGASLMWLVDAVVEYLEEGAAFFEPEFSAMVNDSFLGISVIALAMVIWIVTLLIKDPLGVVRKQLKGEV